MRCYSLSELLWIFEKSLTKHGSTGHHSRLIVLFSDGTDVEAGVKPLRPPCVVYVVCVCG